MHILVRYEVTSSVCPLLKEVPMFTCQWHTTTQTRISMGPRDILKMHPYRPAVKWLGTHAKAKCWQWVVIFEEHWFGENCHFGNKISQKSKGLRSAVMTADRRGERHMQPWTACCRDYPSPLQHPGHAGAANLQLLSASVTVWWPKQQCQ